MYPYYSKCKNTYNKEIVKLLRFGEKDIEMLFEKDFLIIRNQVKSVFESKLLPHIPYVGGKQNANDTNNLIGCCEYADIITDNWPPHGIRKDGLK